MARSSTTTQPMIDRFRYSPGDGHVYVWTAGRSVITVNKIVAGGLTDKIQNRIVTEPTGDTIPAPVSITATAMAQAVNDWRSTR
jgi:hypothetical protein